MQVWHKQQDERGLTVSLTSSTGMVILGWEEKHLAAALPDGAISRLAARFIMIEMGRDNFTWWHLRGGNSSFFLLFVSRGLPAKWPVIWR